MIPVKDRDLCTESDWNGLFLKASSERNGKKLNIEWIVNNRLDEMLNFVLDNLKKNEFWINFSLHHIPLKDFSVSF